MTTELHNIYIDLLGGWKLARDKLGNTALYYKPSYPFSKFWAVYGILHDYGLYKEQ